MGQHHGQDAHEENRLREENGRLRAALRVNLIRLVPGVTHAEIDALIARVVAGETESVAPGA